MVKCLVCLEIRNNHCFLFCVRRCAFRRGSGMRYLHIFLAMLSDVKSDTLWPGDTKMGFCAPGGHSAHPTFFP